MFSASAINCEAVRRVLQLGDRWTRPDLTKMVHATGQRLVRFVLEAEAAKDGKKADVAKSVGSLLGKRAKENGIAAVVFDRGGYRYHGRVRQIAEGAREAGLTL